MMGSVLLAQLTMDNEPIERLYPGWEAIARYRAPAQLNVVLFRQRDTGREACWWVTPEGDYLASHTLALKPDRQTELIECLNPILHPLLNQSLINIPHQPLPVHDPVFHCLEELPTIALTELVGLWYHHVAQSTLIISPHELLEDASQEEEESADSEDNVSEPSPFSAGRVRQVMNCRYHKEHPPTAISPFSLLPLKPQLVMKNRAGVACRFFDPIEELTFYLFWNAPFSDDTLPHKEPLFYYPKGSLILGNGIETNLLPTRLLVWFIQHPDHPDTIRQAPSFRLEDYGIGQISGIWEDFAWSADKEPTVPLQTLPAPHSPAWESWFTNSPVLRKPEH